MKASVLMLRKKWLPVAFAGVLFLLLLTPILRAQTWSAVGGGMNDWVNATTVYNNELIAGGIFDGIDGVGAGNIARWGTVSGVRDAAGRVPAKFSLSQNYPNPFNPSTSIAFSLPREVPVSLKVFDVLGREVATILDGTKQAGDHTVGWNAGGHPSGVYFYRLLTGEYSETKKFVLEK